MKKTWMQIAWYLMHISFLFRVDNTLQGKAINGSQLPKMKEYIPYMSLPWNLKWRSSWSKKFQLYFKNYDCHEYVTFGAISWKFDILSITD